VERWDRSDSFTFHEFRGFWRRITNNLATKKWRKATLVSPICNLTKFQQSMNRNESKSFAWTSFVRLGARRIAAESSQWTFSNFSLGAYQVPALIWLVRRCHLFNNRLENNSTNMICFSWTWGISGLSRIDYLTFKKTASGYLSLNWSNFGAITLHGPHQVVE
jgi:hypothetical protein